MAIKPEAGANASAKRVRRAIKEYMQKNDGMWTGRCFFCVFPVALVWRFSLTSRLPSLSRKSAKKIKPVMQATNWLKAAPKGRIWSKNNGITSGKMTHKTLFQILVELMVLNIVFLTVL